MNVRASKDGNQLILRSQLRAQFNDEDEDEESEGEDAQMD